jgi:hypothetical protein
VRHPTALAVVLAAAALAMGGCERVAPALAKLNPLRTFESRCDELAPSSYQVRVVDAPIAEDRTQSFDSLARMSTTTSPNHRTVGLTQARFAHRSSLAVNGIEDQRSGRVCARPSVTVELSLAPMTVYIAQAYRDDPCREPLIVEHEQRHVDVYRTYVGEAAVRLQKELPRRLGTGLVLGSSMDAAQEQVDAALAATMAAFMEESARILEERNAAIDTPEEYRRISLACGADPDAPR